VTVDLEACRVTAPDGFDESFEIDPFRRECLLKGLDNIGLTLQYADAITAYETKRGIAV
jgi:3-isopropylmalate/(R)-2-methylmalate dehydratase small subunit